MLLILLCSGIIALLIISYWGIPLFPGKDKGYKQPDLDQLSDKVRPIELKSSKGTGILLIHGFEGSPFEMKEMGTYLYELGYSVSIPLLPGHGTSIDDLVKTNFKDWYFHIEKSYFKLKMDCNKIYAIGLSLGGLLAIKLSENHKIDALITISAPVFFNGLYNGKWVMTDFRMFFSGLLSIFFKKIKITRMSNNDICPWEGYENYLAMNCVHSIKINIPVVRKNLYKITNPVCLIHAMNDFTIPVENSYYLFQEIHAFEKREFSFYIPNDLSTNHVLTTHTHVKERVFTYVLQFIKDYESNFQLDPIKLLGTKSYLKFNIRRIGKRIKRWFLKA
jgi:carboxylesterase